MANTIDLGLVTAYGNAKEGGYTGTESQFNTLLANLPTYTSNAAASATAAAASAEDASDAADRAEAIVGGQFISYGGSQGLTNAQKLQARVNAGANVLVITSGSFSSLPQTISNNKITAKHVVLNSVLSNPSAQISDWTVATADGSLTVSGSISGSTTLTLYLYTTD